MNGLSLAATVLAGSLVAGGAATAQSPAASYPPQPGQGPAGAAVVERQTHAVLRITSVEIMRSSREPYLSIVRARGFVSSGGWQEVELVPLTRGPSPDGILQFVLVARPPQPAASAAGYEPVEAVFPLSPTSGYRGVNVHSATNGVTVTTIPGYADASKRQDDDCGICVGKTLVPKGGAVPPGRAGVVREEQLPPLARVVRPTDGLMGMESNPNRLTLLVNDNNVIVGAVWD